MAIEVTEDTIGTGDDTCEDCARLFFKDAGCEFCRERARALAAVPMEPPSSWWCAIPFGTKGYSSSERVKQGHPAMDLAPGIYKWIRSERTWRGFAVHIGISERFGEIWVLQTIDAGVYVRKDKAEAERIMQQAA